MTALKQLYLNSFKGLSNDIWQLSVVSLINRSGTIVILFLSIYLTQELGFSKEQTGIAFACFGIGSVIGSYIGGYLTDRIGYYTVMLWSLILGGFMFFIMMMITNFLYLCLVIILTSLIGDAFRPACQAAISAYSKKENHTRSLSLFRLSINLGYALGGGAAGFIAEYFGYHWLFMIDGITCIAAGIYFYNVLENKKEKEEEEEQKKGAIKKSAYTDIWYLIFLFFLSLNAIAFFQLFNAFPLYCREELLLTESKIGMLIIFNGVLICILEMPLIYLITKYNKQIASIIWGVFLIGIGYFTFNIFGDLAWVTILYTIFISIGEIINFPLTNTVALHRSTVNNRGQYMGLFSMLFSATLIVAPISGLKIAEIYGFQALWAFSGVLCVISTFGLIILFKYEN